MNKREILYSYFTAGMNDHEIAREIGLSQPSVWRWRRRLGFKPHRVGCRSKISDQVIKYACLLFCEKDEFVAKKIGRSKSTLSKRRRRLGIGPRGALKLEAQETTPL